MLFFNNLLLKLQSTKLYKFFFGVFLFLLFFIPNVKAEVVAMTDENTFFGVTFNNSNPLTNFTIPSSPNAYLDIAVSLVNYEGITRPWSYLVIQTCSQGYVARNQVRNTGYTTYFDSSIGYDADITGTTCQMRNGAIGRIGFIQMHVARYGDIDDTGAELSVNSYLRIENPLTYSWTMSVMSIMLSSDDLVTELRQNHLLLQMMTNVNTNTSAINNYLSTINSSISSQTNAINGNIDQEFNDLKNQDHNYNSNPKDTPSGSSDINSTLNKEDQLRSSLNLDSSNVVVTLNTNATTYIWGIVDRIRAVDSRIVLLFTTVLSLGIIKMILNR